jgi:protein involved in polysaccharide export with SLBB domain
MRKLLAAPVVVVVLSFPGLHSVFAQTNVQRGFASSREAYSESKRLYKEGVKYALAGLYPQAAEIFQQAVKLDPQFADAHYALGHAYYDMGRWDKAVSSFQRAIDLNPNDQEARERLEYSRKKLEAGPTRNRTVTAAAPLVRPTAEPVALKAKPPAAVTNPNADSKNEADTKKKGDKKTPDKSEAGAPAATPDAANADANAAAAAAAEFALTKVYRVGAGDVLDVRINDSTAPQSTLFTVTPAGLLEHPLLTEPLRVGGLSVEEIGRNIESELKRRALMEAPKVSVGVRDYASHTILVSGLVKDAGTKILRREAIPLYVVVADSQPLPEAARVTVVRTEANQMYDIDLAQPADMNLLVRPGDVITLHANTTQFLYIGGEVKAPGEKTFRRGLTLTQAIIAAGGTTEKAKEARLGRDDGRGFLNVTRFKLKEIESGKVADPPVQPGDRIMIVK